MRDRASDFFPHPSTSAEPGITDLSGLFAEARVRVPSDQDQQAAAADQERSVPDRLPAAVAQKFLAGIEGRFPNEQ
jgi:hypothetical protein